MIVFSRTNPPYNAGESASFSVEEERRLIRLGVAVAAGAPEAKVVPEGKVVQEYAPPAPEPEPRPRGRPRGRTKPYNPSVTK